MKHHFCRFMRTTDGSTTVVFSICLLSIVLACGAAIDYSRWNSAQTAAVAVTDSAALAAVSQINPTEENMKKVAKDYVASNIKSLGLQVDGEPKFTYNSTKAEFTVELQGGISTSLMGLAGIDEMAVNARSVAVKPAIPPIEMVLALDTTGSMAGTKITALKAAADKMVTAVLKNKDAKIGVVPFSNYVNIGVSRRNQSFFEVPADYTVKTDSCTTSYPDKKGCKIVKTNKTCSSTNDGVTTYYACTSSSEVCDSWGAALKTCKKVDSYYKFYGCIGSRDEAKRAKLDDSSKKYPGFLNVTCGAEIQDLTADLTAAKNKVKALTATGETYLPGGLTWGWNMLTSAEPLTAAENATALADKGGRKVMVFMTDGANTLVPSSKGKGGHGSATSSVYKSVAYANTLTAELCENIKKDKIDIYTVQFDVADSALKSLLTNCASSPTMSFEATDADELVEAFDKIVQDLAQIRIVR